MDAGTALTSIPPFVLEPAVLLFTIYMVFMASSIDWICMFLRQSAMDWPDPGLLPKVLFHKSVPVSFL